ncbi:hypothetical protein [Enterococcus casseliflavus]|uniref:hypothetical protein n=1 Tax=Enterococcus casseliflavus TaxID=37734 RepID=UPI003390DA91
MLYRDNEYTQMLGSLLSKIHDPEDSKFQPIFLVGDNLIFGNVVSFEDDRLTKTEISENGSLLFTIAANVNNIRGKHFASDFPESDTAKFEPVYLYLEDVLIHSTSGNKTIQIPEFALRISSIDGISSGNPEQFKSQ